MNGVPGASSQLGNFLENGPLLLTQDGLVVNAHSFNLDYNILYLDNPIGVGFSNIESDADQPHNQDEAAEQFYYAIQ